MNDHDAQRADLEAELQRIYGGSSHLRVAADPNTPWPEADVTRVLTILRSLPDGAGEAAVKSALGITDEDVGGETCAHEP